MIYTVTFNPSLDYIVRLDQLHTGAVNRTTYEQILAGGKGINVSIVLKNLGQVSTALGFVAGFTGGEIIRQLEERGCLTDFIQLPQGNSRINVKIKAETESEVNGQGPTIPKASLAQLYAQLDRLTSEDLLVLAGSVPNTLPNNIYQLIMERLAPKNIPILVDATKQLLMNVLPYRPFLIKPNIHELEELFETSLKTHEEIIQHVHRLQKLGAQNGIVSMAGNGAILVTAQGASYYSPAPQGKVVNSVGAGDSMVAGFISGFLETHSLEQAFYMGIATGSASAFSDQLATLAEAKDLLKKIHH